MKDLWLSFGSAALLAVSQAAAQTVEPAAAPIPAAPAIAPTNAPAPHVQFATPVFDFGRIVGGATVTHNYYFTNTGNAPLDISHVGASCGCTTAGQWTRNVPPGGSGYIPIQFNSGRFRGVVFKTVTVTCNDPKQSNITLQLRGDIWKPIEVQPEYAVMHGNTETLSGTKVSVRVISAEPEPLFLTEPTSSSSAFTVQLNTNQPGKDYELLVSPVPPLDPRNLQGTITVKTTSTNMPVLNVTAMVALQPVITTSPAQIMLPPTAQPGNRTLAVSIINQGTNNLVLSDAQANVPEIAVQLAELAPGKNFTLTLTVPGDFELKPGQPAEVSVKSNHPQHPVIKVPLYQTPRPAVARPTAPQPPPAIARPATSQTVIRPTPGPVAKPMANVRPAGAPPQRSEPPPMPPMPQ